jgi:excisionase family DNA binding protein
LWIRAARHTLARKEGVGRLDGKKLAYSVEEACEALGIGRALAYELIMSGRLHSIKVGARRLVPASALADFLGGAA